MRSAAAASNRPSDSHTRPGARVELLESRTLLSTVKIPVLEYHRVLQGADTSFTDKDVTVGQFSAQMDYLKAQGFTSITLQQYKSWRANTASFAMPAKPFIAIFDDANYTDILRAAPIMQDHGFKGVTAVPTGRVGTRYGSGASARYMNWPEVRHLTSHTWIAEGRTQPYGWELASHSVTHPFLGVKNRGTSDAKYKNTPKDIRTELVDSKTALGKNVYYDLNGNDTQDSGEVSVPVVAFVHPHDDATVRSLALAAPHYDMIFATSYAVGEGKFIGQESGLQNGDLIRVRIDKATVELDFEAMLGRATNSDPFQRPGFAYSSAYRARNGVIVVDGKFNSSGSSNKNDRIELNSQTTVLFNGVSTPIDVAVNPDGLGDVVQGFDVSGRAGNDTIILSLALPSVINGDSGLDSITGGAANDTLLGGAGNDRIDGGGGDDLIIESSNGGQFTLTSSSLTGQDTDQLISIERASLSGSAVRDVINAAGFSGPVTLAGGDGNDELTGGPNADSITGGKGDDVISGGLGNDIIAGEIGNDTLGGAGGKDKISGGDGDDVINGENGNDQLFGEGGKDSIHAGRDNDYVEGGDDADSIWGDQGDDTLNGQSSNDKLYGGDGSDQLLGGRGDDRLEGGDGTDSLYGQDGNDLFYTRDTLRDVLEGGEGVNDRAQVDAGVDSVSSIDTLLA